MGIVLSNKRSYENNPLFATVDPNLLRTQILKYQNINDIQELLDIIPFACNYNCQSDDYITKLNRYDNYKKCNNTLRFLLYHKFEYCPGSKILLTREQKNIIRCIDL